MKLYSIAQIRHVEKMALREHAMTEMQLMQTAGCQACSYLQRYYPHAKRLLVVCGPGNNGGDGFVLAYQAHESGLQVHMVLLAEPAAQGPAREALNACRQAGVPIEPFTSSVDWTADVIVDALLGIGLARAITGDYARAIDAMQFSGVPIVALDTPSGVDADTGAVGEVTVKAKHTLTFIGNKQGFYAGPAREYCGHITVCDLDLPGALLQAQAPQALLLEAQTCRASLPPRRHNAHKGDFGHVLVVGGEQGMAGAACMAGLAALRAGAGLASIATRVAHAPSMVARQPELMVHGVASAQDCQALIARASVIVVGPGLGQSDWAKALCEAVFAANKPCVIDADALTFFALAHEKPQTCIITPHPGEAARWLGCDTNVIQAARFSAARDLQTLTGGIAVLKGANTVIAAAADEPLSVCDAGNPGMASGGMGDVLSGVIAGLLAQKLSASDAAKLGVLTHALAGDKVAAIAGQRGMLATDLLAPIQVLLNKDNADDSTQGA